MPSSQGMCENPGGQWPLVHRRIEEQAARKADSVAVVFGDERLSYGELDQRSNQLAHHLVELGVGPDVLVGICMERSLELVVAVVGVLKAGGAYVPLDPVYPRQRLEHMLKDSGTRVLLTQKRLAESLPDPAAHVLCLDSQWPEVAKRPAAALAGSAAAGHLVYVIYTSGSTGQPKGAALYHRGFANLLDWYVRQFGFGVDDRVLLMTSFSFDLTQKNIFAPLISGGRLILLETPHFDAATIVDTVEAHGVTTINCTPSAFYGLLSSPDEALFRKLRSLRYVFLGGEPISFARLESWLHNPLCQATVVNTYGPTECTDVCAFYRLHDYDRYPETGVPTGVPIANTDLYILGPDLEPVADGEPGELCIGGVGVGAGYINRPGLTAEKFIADPFSGRPGARLYRTGDRVRMLADGNIQFLGRIDHQVKVRGFRIELGEIESALEKHPALRQAVVLAREDEAGDKRLVAYLVTQPGLLATVGEIRAFLQTRLPDYMLPTRWVFMDRLPLTPNGKVDRQSLPPPDHHRPELDQPLVPPGNDLERYLARFWCSLLNLDEIGIHDRFFELGGTSIKAIQFVGRLAHELGATLPITDFFQAPTIAEYARLLVAKHGDRLVDRLGVELPSSALPFVEGAAGSRSAGVDIPSGRVPGQNAVDPGAPPGRRRRVDRGQELLERRRRHRNG